MHYSKESERGEILNGLKISFRKELHTNKKIFTNICFSKNCYINDGSCRIENYRQIDNESSQMLINNNNIELKYNNDIEFYDPETFYLYSRTKITDKAISHIKTIRKLYISFLVYAHIAVRMLFVVVLARGLQVPEEIVEGVVAMVLLEEVAASALAIA